MKKVDKFTSLDITERNGKYSLLEGWEGQSGEFKPNFCKREFGKKGEKVEKTAPVFINIGDKAQAIEVAVWMYEYLTGKPMGEPYQRQDIPDADVPF